MKNVKSETNWNEKFHDLFSKYVELSILDCRLIDDQISDIDATISSLQLIRKKLVAKKHFIAKERMEVKKGK